MCLCVINSLTTPGYALWNTNTPKANSFSGAAVSLNWDTHTHTPVPRTHLHTELTFDTKSHTFPIEKLPGVVCVWDYTLSPSSRSLRLKHVKNVTELLGCYSQRNSFSTESTSWIRYITFVKYLILVRITPKWGQKHTTFLTLFPQYIVQYVHFPHTLHVTEYYSYFFPKCAHNTELNTFTFSHLADAFIQSNLQMRTIEAINTNKRE